MGLRIVRGLDLLAREGLDIPGGHIAQQSPFYDRLVPMLALLGQPGVIGGEPQSGVAAKGH